ncbi:MAG: formate dehydrogenase subunit alpha [Kiritimatiellaeota bacterium]|nr:formate dehydrogenase subunit alpha [Kiritimatiellota bacterium]
METISLMIDGRQVSAAEGTTILEAARTAGIHIPHLCWDPRVEPIGSCRLCAVRIEGRNSFFQACSTTAVHGMQVTTEDAEIAALRKGILELIFADHHTACPTCDRDGNCKLQDYAYRYGADHDRFGAAEASPIRSNYASANYGIAYVSEKCIKCGLCVKYCETVQMAEAITLAWRQERTAVTTAFGVDLHESPCELCGGCIRVCPAGAMLDRKAIGKGRDRNLNRVRTICPYCGVGCQMDLLTDPVRNRIVRVTAVPGSPINDGNLCVKGHFGFDFVSSEERLTQPLLRKADGFAAVTWDEALDTIGTRLRRIREKHGPEGLAFVSSCRCSNEENYLMQKLARAAAGTNNVDQCATTCHAPTVAGLASAFGSGAMTNSVREIRDCDVLFVIGANPTEAHPIVGLEMKRALRRGAKLVVCDPRRTWLAARAHVHIQHRPGSDNMLLNAMMRFIIDEGLQDRAFVAERCEEFDVFEENLRAFSVEEAAIYCGVKAEDIRQAARLYANGSPSAIFYTLGITEHTCGTDNVRNLANLAMLCGQIGKWASGVNPLRGQNNVQGGCDMGAMPHKLPGYQNWSDDAVRAKFERAWDRPLPTNPGGRVTHFVEEAGAGTLKALYVMGEDLVVSEPNQAKVVRHLRQLEFLVCQDLFLTETAKLAHMVLPGACWAEKDGTFTASERRVQRFRRAVLPPGEAKPDWEILCLVSEALGYPMHYADPSEIFSEMARLTPSYAGMSYARLGDEGLQWPCPDPDHPGTRFLHEGTFARGKGKFQPIGFQPQKEEPDESYPLILSTGRTLYNYNSGSMTRKTGIIRQKESANFVEIHTDTAARYGIADGDRVRVRTRRGVVAGRAVVGERVRPDSIWMPFHFAEAPANAVTNDVFDPETATAEYKCCAAALEKAEA